MNFAYTRCAPKRPSISTGKWFIRVISTAFRYFGIQAHGFWTAKADVRPRLFALVSYAAGEEPGEVGRRYMQSTEFANDTRDFDVADIVGAESTILIPSTSSPLT